MIKTLIRQQLENGYEIREEQMNGNYDGYV